MVHYTTRIVVYCSGKILDRKVALSRSHVTYGETGKRKAGKENRCPKSAWMGKWNNTAIGGLHEERPGKNRRSVEEKSNS